MGDSPIFEAVEVKKYFYGKKKILSKKEVPTLRAVDGVSLEVYPGETIGLVGESGCGKSTMGRCLIKMQDPTEGTIRFKGEDITNYSLRKMKPLRAHMQMIFQDPYNSLNPRKFNYDSVYSALKHVDVSPAEKKYMVAKMLEYVGVSKDHFYKFPHELSGGQRQRVIIARAMVSNPEFIVCDEPVSALDVSVRSQVLNLMKDIQEERKLSYLFISHDMSVIRFLCDRVIVMYLGKIVEEAPKEVIFSRAVHPYTRALMSAIPTPNVKIARTKERIVLQGDIPSPWEVQPGCRFASRCPHATEECRSGGNPPLVEIEPDHLVACHKYKSL